MIKILLGKVLTFLIVFFLAQRVNAQFSSHGVSAGIHISNLNVVPSAVLTNPLAFYYQPQTGYHIGGYYRTGLGLVYFEPQSWITILNHSINYRDNISGVLWEDNINLIRLDMPLEMGIHVGPFLAIYAPVFSIPLRAQSFMDIQLNKSGSWSNQIGIGLKLMKFQVSLRYESPNTFTEALAIESFQSIYAVEISQIIAVVSMRL
jgi:hypothetical protein